MTASRSCALNASTSDDKALPMSFPAMGVSLPLRKVCGAATAAAIASRAFFADLRCVDILPAAALEGK
jgi:hypothetical protein